MRCVMSGVRTAAVRRKYSASFVNRDVQRQAPALRQIHVGQDDVDLGHLDVDVR